jgi:DNA invertase Pin-like site-specific DNA recombinase
MMLLNELHERGIDFKSLTEGIDTTTSFGQGNRVKHIFSQFRTII